MSTAQLSRQHRGSAAWGSQALPETEDSLNMAPCFTARTSPGKHVFFTRRAKTRREKPTPLWISVRFLRKVILYVSNNTLLENSTTTPFPELLRGAEHTVTFPVPSGEALQAVTGEPQAEIGPAAAEQPAPAPSCACPEHQEGGLTTKALLKSLQTDWAKYLRSCLLSWAQRASSGRG